MKPLSEIQEILRKHSAELRERYGIASLSVFGSVVRGEARENSDVDILAVFERPIGMLALCSAENYLISLLGVEVDLIPREDVRPELMERVYAEAVPI
jgi:predicted nucleotidyltransferase